MSNLTPDPFRPQLGLSSIDATPGTETDPSLPDDYGPEPIDAFVEARLAEILEAKNFQRVMLDSIRPTIADRSILKPAAFHGIRRELVALLEQARFESKSIEEKMEIDSLDALLQKMAADHELGEQYRYTLLKG